MRMLEGRTAVATFAKDPLRAAIRVSPRFQSNKRANTNQKIDCYWESELNIVQTAGVAGDELVDHHDVGEGGVQGLIHGRSVDERLHRPG
jgi:hypothetical protein